MQRSKLRVSKDEYASKLKHRRQTAAGAELVSSTPMAPPVGYVKHPSMVDIIREQIRSHELAKAAERAGAETFEEADDFAIDEDIEPQSAYEFEDVFEPPVKVVPKDMPASEPGQGAGQGAQPAEGGAEGGLDPESPSPAKLRGKAPKAAKTPPKAKDSAST